MHSWSEVGRKERAAELKTDKQERNKGGRAANLALVKILVFAALWWEKEYVRDDCCWDNSCGPTADRATSHCLWGDCRKDNMLYRWLLIRWHYHSYVDFYLPRSAYIFLALVCVCVVCVRECVCVSMYVCVCFTVCVISFIKMWIVPWVLLLDFCLNYVHLVWCGFGSECLAQLKRMWIQCLILA